MNAQLIAAAFIGTALSTSAFAQSTFAQPAPATAAIGPAAQIASNAATPPHFDGGWVAPSGQRVVQKTRAQVYQELIDAQKSGELAYLNSTLYAN